MRQIKQMTWRVVLIGLSILMLCSNQGLVEAIVKQDRQSEQVQTSTRGQQQPLDSLERFRAPGQLEHSLPEKHRQPEYAPGEVIVKFKDSVKECVHCLLEEKRSFANATSDSSNSLDQLNKRYQVKSARPLCSQWHHKSITESKRMYQKAMEETKRKFPHRFARAPKNAKQPDFTHIYVLEVTKDADIPAICEAYNQDPEVEYAEPNYIYTIQMVPNDPYYSSKGSWGQSYDDLWGLKKIQAAQAWDSAQGEGVVVAVVDTGIDYIHEDIAANIWTNTREVPNNGIDDDNNGYVDDVRGWDFTTCTASSLLGCSGSKLPDNDPMDGNGHGTHVAGTIAAIGNNGIGVIGVAPKAKVMAVKGLDNGGVGYTSELANSLYYAVNNGANIINNSWGRSGFSALIEEVINFAYAQGCVVVAAAGNSASDASFFSPAGLVNVITVSATHNNDARASFSNYGKPIDVAAPGVDILSLRAANTDMYGDKGHFVPQGDINAKYYRANGTSMAAPHLSGLAALILSRYPQFSNAQVKSAIGFSADDLGISGRDDIYGYGRINAVNALQNSAPGIIPYAFIKSPKFKEVIKGDNVDVVGSVISEMVYFKGASLRYETPHLDPVFNWIDIPMTSSGIMVNEVLGKWHLSDINDGYYSLNISIDSRDPKNLMNQTITESHQTLVQVGNKIKEGWPLPMEGAITAAPLLGDLDRDGTTELVVIDEQNKLYVFHADGRVASEWGWPREIRHPYLNGEFNGFAGQPALGDLDNDPSHDLEIVVGHEYVFHHEGTPVRGWPNPAMVSLKTGGRTPVLSDIDGDGRLEVIVIVKPYTASTPILYVLRSDGSIYWLKNGYYFSENCAVGDVDGDGKKEIVIGDIYGSFYLWNYQGNLLAKWTRPPMTRADPASAPILGDINNDGRTEVIGVTSFGYINAWYFDENLKLFKSLPGWGKQVLKGYASGSNYDERSFDDPALADILKEDGSLGRDGKPELIFSASDATVLAPGNFFYVGRVYVIDSNGNIAPGWPQETGTLWDSTGKVGTGGMATSPIVIDIDGDGFQDIIAGSINRKLWAWHGDGSLVKGFPMDLGSMFYEALSPVSGDIDGNGMVDLIVATGERAGLSSLVVLDTTPKLYNILPGGHYDPTVADWPMLHHDPQHTGLYTKSSLPPPANRLPVLTAIGDQQVNENVLITFSVTGNDPDNDQLTLTTSSLPTGSAFRVTLDQNGKIDGVFSWQPDYAQAGEYPMTFTLSDGKSTTSQTIKIKVINVNRKPVLGAIGHQQIMEGKSLSFTVSATDSDGDALTYSTTGLPTGASFDGVTQTFNWTPDFTQAGSYEVAFTASDGELIASETIVITVVQTDILSGRVLLKKGDGLADVLISVGYPAVKVNTDANGEYKIPTQQLHFSKYNGACQVWANKVGYTITPVRQWVRINGGDVTVPNFLTKRAKWYTISGRVCLPNGSGLAGVKVVIPWVAETTTDGNGEYHLLYLRGTYEVSASKTGYTIIPQSQQATIQDRDVTLPKFTAPLKRDYGNNHY